MKIHGEEGWERYPSYLDIFVPYVLNVLKDLDKRITFFIVGKDASLEHNHTALKAIVNDGHEVGNHSFKHETWLHLYTPKQLEQEITKAHETIAQATGQEPIGFRGPGFSWSHDLLEVLREKGYIYDASTLPTFIGPLARMYYFSTSKLSKAEKQDRKELFGKFSDGWRKVKPYRWLFDSGRELLEVPVTTMPIFKLPFHLSYLIYLSNFSISLMTLYLKSAIYLCKWTNTQPSFLLHPLDLIGGDQITNLAFFPGMNVSSERKIFLFKKVIGILSDHFQLVPMNEHVRHLQNNPRLMGKSIRVATNKTNGKQKTN